MTTHAMTEARQTPNPAVVNAAVEGRVAAPSAALLLYLQRTAGNQAVNRLLQRYRSDRKTQAGGRTAVGLQPVQRYDPPDAGVPMDASTATAGVSGGSSGAGDPAPTNADQTGVPGAVGDQSSTSSGADPAGAAGVGDDAARRALLATLLAQITEQTAADMQARAALDALPEQSSDERTTRQTALDTGRAALIDLLQRRVVLLDAEIAALNAQAGPNPTSSPDHPEVEAIGNDLNRFAQEKARHEHQLRPLLRWQTRRRMAAIDAQVAEIDQELSTLPPVSDPDHPAAELLLTRRNGLEQEKTALARSLTAGATEYKQFDSRWGATRYGTSPECTNIQAAGCGPTSLAIALNYLYQEDPESLAAQGQFEIVTPPQTAAYAATHGRICNNGTSGDTMVSHVQTAFPGFRGRRVDLGAAAGIIRGGNVVIFLCHACSGTNRGGGSKSYGGHFMVLNGVNDQGTVFNVLDPGAGESTDIETITRTELRQHTAGFWVIEPK